ncbi:MAG TPA: invasin domain 3-containing protein [Bdellovibrionota bacterium]|nr:invasin domain 3-containing protein [Bdellovibrionota bacterium]
MKRRTILPIVTVILLAACGENNNTEENQENTQSSVPDAQASTVTANPEVVTADGISASTITARVADLNGNPWAFGEIQIGVWEDSNVILTGDGFTILDPSFATDQSGVAQATIVSTLVGSRTIAAQVSYLTQYQCSQEICPGASALQSLILEQQPVIQFVER